MKERTEAEARWDIRWDEWVKCSLTSIGVDDERTLEAYCLSGVPPGSQIRSALVGDYRSYIMTSHPNLSVRRLKALIYAIEFMVPPKARGSASAVDRWTGLRY